MTFDEYRERYDSLTDDEHRAAYREWEAQYPEQVHCSHDALKRFIAEHCNILSVVEMGGWDGGAARAMLDVFVHLSAWYNIEVCAEAAARPASDSDRYHAIVPAQFRWWRPMRVVTEPHLFVAANVIEHLSTEDASDLIDTLRPHAWFIEAPIAEEGQDWAGYNGSHVLRAGWRTLEQWLREAGYERAWVDGNARSYVRAP